MLQLFKTTGYRYCLLALQVIVKTFKSSMLTCNSNPHPPFTRSLVDTGRGTIIIIDTPSACQRKSRGPETILYQPSRLKLLVLIVVTSQATITNNSAEVVGSSLD